MKARGEARLWIAQRATAVVLALCITVHLVTIVYAVRNGLDAAHVLARTRSNYAWAAFYCIFVAAAAIHGAIGLRTVAAEWLRFRGAVADRVMVAIAIVLAFAGLVAVAAVVGAP